MNDANPTGTIPLVSVIIPAYRSGKTIEASLASIEGQTFRDFEVIVVESSGDAATAELVARKFPSVRFVASEKRLFPHAARNQGVELARGKLLVFTDPDIYLVPHWLHVLVEAWSQQREVVVGSFACHGDGMLDAAFHMTKFSKWMPDGTRRTVDMAPSGNMLVSRADFDRAGAFPGDLFIGDVELSRKLQASGLRCWFEPSAVASHHHLYSLREFLVERHRRGVLYGELRSTWFRERRWTLAWLTIATILPVRLMSNLARVTLHVTRTGALPQLLLTFPIVVAGFAASLAGEARAYVAALVRGGTSSVRTSKRLR